MCPIQQLHHLLPRGHSKCLVCYSNSHPYTQVAGRVRLRIIKYSCSDESLLLHRVCCLEASLINNGQGSDRVSVIYKYVYKLCSVQSVSLKLITQDNCILEVAMCAYWHCVCMRCIPAKRHIRPVMYKA